MAGNGFLVGLPPGPKNADMWHEKAPLLARLVLPLSLRRSAMVLKGPVTHWGYLTPSIRGRSRA